MKVHNHDEWEGLTKIINDYMISKNWTIEDGLNYLKCILVKSAKMAGVKKTAWMKACKSMEKDFDTYKGRIDGGGLNDTMPALQKVNP